MERVRSLALMALCGLLTACGNPPSDATGNQTGRPTEAIDVRYSCGGDITFTAEHVAEGKPPAQDVLSALHELRQTMDGAILPPAGWIEVHKTADRVTVLAPLGEAFASASFRYEGGRWGPSGWGDCIPRLHIPNRSVLRWAFTPASYPPRPDETEFEIVVSEVDCSSGRDIRSLIEPTISYGEEEISVLLTAPGLSGDQTCPGRAPTPFRLSLQQPPGDRRMVDPSAFPVVEPTPGTRLP